MAETNSSKKSEGLCEKIHNAVSPFRPRVRRISDQPRRPISIATDNNAPQTKPVRVLHQSKTIPVDFRHFPAHDSGKESDEKDIGIVRGQRFTKSSSGKEELVLAPHHVHFAKAGSKKDDDRNSGRFSDYISKFKNRMMKTASDVSGGGASGGGGGGGGGGNGGGVTSTRRDSFNDKVTSYIDRAKIKIRTTTNVGADQKNN